MQSWENHKSERDPYHVSDLATNTHLRAVPKAITTLFLNWRQRWQKLGRECNMKSTYWTLRVYTTRCTSQSKERVIYYILNNLLDTSNGVTLHNIYFAQVLI